ncbi:MAG: hypothetical protein KBT88_11900 [Gammaproteobacteria bacterium]|nr:hypothetical protein [Gammaproteobacteria bacterium]MBQ0840478.1 hypothetical protein [Gammaproteobacteria bacterium]
MKSLLIALVIMAPLYLLLCQEQTKKMEVLSESSNDGETNEPSAAENSNGVKALHSFNRPLDKAKGVEAMLNQGVEDRLRNVDGLDGGK